MTTGGEDKEAALIRANALSIPLADESVDLIITSPPYFALRSYRDGDEHYDGQIGSEATPQAFLEALWAVTAECWRVLKPSGSLWVNLGDKYAGSGGHNNSGVTGGPSKLKSPGYVDRLHAQAKATRRNAPDCYTQNSDGIRAKSLLGLPWRYAIGCIDGLAAPNGQRWILRAEVVWSKPNGLPESVTDRVRRSHEQWFHMTRSPRYFAAVDEVREPHVTPISEVGNKGGTDHRVEDLSGATRLSHLDTLTQNPLGKLPGSVWQIPSEPLKVPPELNVEHFAAFTSELPRRTILGWSPNGICLECGEGRRPVVDVEQEPIHTQRRKQGLIDLARPNGEGAGNAFGPSGGDSLVTRRHTTITGYACACPDDSAPTRPAVVLDPFCGTGTVPMMARVMGRFGIGIDLSADYLRLARWRIWESGHGEKRLAKAAGKPPKVKKKPAPPSSTKNQDVLF